MEFKTNSDRSHWSPGSRLTHPRNFKLDTKNDGLWKGVSQASNFECGFFWDIYVEFQGVSSWSVENLELRMEPVHHWSPTGLLHML